MKKDKDKLNSDLEKKDDKYNLNLDDEKARKYKIIRIIINSIIVAIILGGLIFGIIKLWPIFNEISSSEEAQNEFVEKIRSYGWASSFIIIGLQIGQVIFMVIPSGPIVLTAGLVLNPVWAVFACLIGQTVGGAIVYCLVKLFGYHFLALFVNPDKIKNSKMFGNKRKTEVMMMGYLFIPALPKDIVAFIAPFTKVNLLNFCIINFFSRIPMTIVTVILGGALMDIFAIFRGQGVSSNFVIGMSLAGLSLLFAILCFAFNKKIVAFLERKSVSNNEE